ncbi:MAG: hypothetical protein IJ736_11350, partial [Firmicutes bacterium]|nr:hypothetical protein [Bacillota bacterium]
GTSESTSEATTDSTSEATTAGTSESTSEATTAGTSEATTESTSEATTAGTSESTSEATSEEVNNAPDAIYIGNNGNSVNVIDGTKATYWRINSTGDGLTEGTENSYNVMYDGKGNLTLYNFDFKGNGNYTNVTGTGSSQTSGVIALHGNDKRLNIIFKGNNRIESTGGADFYRHALRAEGTYITFIGDETAVLTLVSGDDSGEGYSAAMVVNGAQIKSGTLVCDGTKNNCNGIISFQNGIKATGGTLIAKGSRQAVLLNGNGIDESGIPVHASKDMNGEDMTAYESSQHDSYKYIRISDKNNKTLFINGDADGDGKITVSDAICVYKKVLDSGAEMPIEKLINVYTDILDMDNDKRLTANDVALILKRVQ